MSFFEGLSTDWLMVAGLVFVLPKLVFGSLVVLLANAEKVPLLDRLLGDRIRGLKAGLRNIHPFKGQLFKRQSLTAAPRPITSTTQAEAEDTVLPKR